MFTYITKELPEVVSSYFPVDPKNKSITGFSMGGHGSLITALKTGEYRSCSAFSPISNPTQSEWGTKGFKIFFEKPEEEGKEYDSTEIIRSGKYHKVPLFIDNATNDQFKEKLLIQNLRDQLI